MNFKGVVLLTLGTVSFSLSAETVVWCHFDDTIGMVREEGYEYPNAVNVDTHPTKLVSFKQSWGGTFIPLMATNFLSAPCSAFRLGASGETFANVSAISHTYNPVDSDDHGGGVITVTETPTEEDLHLQSGTVEWFMKTTTAGHWATLVSRWNGNDGHYFDLYTEGNNLKLSYYYDSVDGTGGVTTARETLTLNDSVFNSIRNDRWHHVAFTFDAETHLFKFYVDYVQYASVSYKGNFSYCAGAGWTFGGRANAGMKCGGAWDEIRISDTALEPSEMLHFGSTLADGDTILHFPFDGDFDSIAGAGLNVMNDACARERNQFIEAGKVGFDVLRYRRITEYADRKAVIRSNDVASVYSLQCQPKVALGDFHLEAYDTSMTIEFFMKAEDTQIPKWALILGLETANGGAGNRLLLVSRDGEDGLECKMDNPTESGGVIDTQGLSLYDGQWHHVAFVITPGTWNGKPTENTQLWVDYKKPTSGYKSQMGTLTPNMNLVLKIGADHQSVRINDLRVSKGALTKDKFMCSRSGGGMFFSVR